MTKTLPMNHCLPASSFFLRILLLAAFAVKLLAEDTAGSDPATRDSRAQLASQVQRNVAAGNRTMALIREQTKRLDEEAQAEFNRIADVVQSAEKRLRRTLKYVENASADEWPMARATLEASYETYAQAIVQAESFLTIDSAPTGRGRDQR